MMSRGSTEIIVDAPRSQKHTRSSTPEYRQRGPPLSIGPDALGRYCFQGLSLAVGAIWAIFEIFFSLLSRRPVGVRVWERTGRQQRVLATSPAEGAAGESLETRLLESPGGAGGRAGVPLVASRKLNSPIEGDSTHHASKPDRKPSPGRHRTARAERRGARAVGLANRCMGGAPRRMAGRAKRMGGPARALALGLVIGSLPSNNVSSASCLLGGGGVGLSHVQMLLEHTHRRGGAKSVLFLVIILRRKNKNVFFFSFFSFWISLILSSPRPPLVWCSCLLLCFSMPLASSTSLSIPLAPQDLAYLTPWRIGHGRIFRLINH